jgi:hypothetical protein
MKLACAFVRILLLLMNDTDDCVSHLYNAKQLKPTVEAQPSAINCGVLNSLFPYDKD